MSIGEYKMNSRVFFRKCVLKRRVQSQAWHNKLWQWLSDNRKINIVEQFQSNFDKLLNTIYEDNSSEEDHDHTTYYTVLLELLQPEQRWMDNMMWDLAEVS